MPSAEGTSGADRTTSEERQRRDTMKSGKTIVALSDGEARLVAALDVLRGSGLRVLATSLAYEAARWLGRPEGTVLVARHGLLPEDRRRFMSDIRAVAPSAPVVVIVSHPSAIDASLPIDRWITEPVTADELAAAVADLATEHSAPTANLRHANVQNTEPLLAVAAGVPPGATPKIYEVVHGCRVLSELECDREQLIQRGLRLFMQITGSSRASLMLKSPETGRLRLVSCAGFPAEMREPVEVEVGEGIAGHVAASEQPLLVADAAAHVPKRAGRRYDGDSFMVAPLLTRSSVVGVVNLTNRVGGGAYDQDDLIHAMMIADQFAVNLVNAEAINDLRTMTLVDTLTHLFNRRHFDSELKKEVERARRYGRELTLALIDVDDFKTLNDEYGYSTADSVLKAVASILRRTFRETDTVTRWGGDEFAVILPETGIGIPSSRLPSPRKCIERIHETLGSPEFARIVPAVKRPVTISIGAATFPRNCKNDIELFNRATLALQDAKRRGNGTSFAD